MGQGRPCGAAAAPHATRGGALVRQLALIDGVDHPLERAALGLTDAGVARGDGAFETVGVWDGRPFRLDDHLRRLDASLAAIGLPAAPGPQLRADVGHALDGQGGDAALRLYVTGSGTRIVTLSEPPLRPDLRRLVSQPAPWIRPLGTYGPSAAKTMSYGPNMAASRAAQRAGGDDALLVSLEGVALEGPTFAVLWVRAGVLEAPPLELGLVDSISRRTLLALAEREGIAHRTVRCTVGEVVTADEVLACSSVRPAQRVAMVDDHRLPDDAPVTHRLATALEEARRSGSWAP